MTCDKGIHSRTRHCNDPAPMHGGKDCVRENQQVGECKARSCVLGKRLAFLRYFDFSTFHIWGTKLLNTIWLRQREFCLHDLVTA